MRSWRDSVLLTDNLSFKPITKMESQEKICTLCLQKCEHFKSVDEETKNILDIFLPKLDLSGIAKPVMCENCAEALKKCYDFKATCLYTHDSLVPFANNTESVQLDIKDVYLRKNVNVTSIPRDMDICGFCMSLIKNCLSIAVDVKSEDFMFEKMIEQCLPELDLSIIKKPVICEDCHKSLENCFRFVTKCSIVEENIKKYRENLDVNSKDQIELTDLLHSTIILQTHDVDSNPITIVKVESQYCQEIEDPEDGEIGSKVDIIKQEQMYFNSEIDNNIGNKSESFMALPTQRVEIEPPFTSPKIFALEPEDNQLDAIKMEETLSREHNTNNEVGKCVEMDDRKLCLKEEIEIKIEDLGGSKEGDTAIQLETQSSKHNDSPLVTMYKCQSCPYWTKHKNMLDEHLLKHNKLSGSDSEVTLYKCDSCTYQAKYKQSVVRHFLLKHRDPSEVMVYKCDFCQFETKHKVHHRIHLQKHMDPSEITMYKCDFCSFQTRHKSSLNPHLLKHMDPSEVKMFKCDFCLFETRHKYPYKRHIKKHNAPLEGAAYNCDLCMFQAKRKSHFTLHMRKHNILK